jgi:hypothetical protein
MPVASTVITIASEACSVSSTETLGNPRVRLQFGDVTVFFSPDDAAEVGENLIAAAAALIVGLAEATV